MTKTSTILAVLALSVLSASAQKKLWTWKIKDTSPYCILTSITLNQDGSGAFVLGEAPARGKSADSYLLVWVDPKGKVMLSRRFAATGKQALPWELAFTGPGKLVAAYDKKAFIFNATGGNAKFVKSISVDNILLFTSSTFGGWVDRSGESYLIEGEGAGEPGEPGYSPYVPDQIVQYVDSLTAWKY